MCDLRDETNRFLAMPEERLGPNESGAWAQTLSEPSVARWAAHQMSEYGD